MQRRIANIAVPAMRLFREQSGFSLHDLAKKTGLSASSLGRIERGETVPRIDSAERIADALNKQMRDMWEMRF